MFRNRSTGADNARVTSVSSEVSSRVMTLSKVAASPKSAWRLFLRPSSKLETMAPKAARSISP